MSLCICSFIIYGCYEGKGDTLIWKGKVVPFLGSEMKVKVEDFTWQAKGGEWTLCLHVAGNGYNGDICQDGIAMYKQGEQSE